MKSLNEAETPSSYFHMFNFSKGNLPGFSILQTWNYPADDIENDQP